MYSFAPKIAFFQATLSYNSKSEKQHAVSDLNDCQSVNSYVQYHRIMCAGLELQRQESDPSKNSLLKLRRINGLVM